MKKSTLQNIAFAGLAFGMLFGCHACIDMMGAADRARNLAAVELLEEFPLLKHRYNLYMSKGWIKEHELRILIEKSEELGSE
jgi:hypothetical protein